MSLALTLVRVTCNVCGKTIQAYQPSDTVAEWSKTWAETHEHEVPAP